MKGARGSDFRNYRTKNSFHYSKMYGQISIVVSASVSNRLRHSGHSIDQNLQNLNSPVNASATKLFSKRYS